MPTPNTITEMISERNDLIDELQYAPEPERSDIQFRINNLECLISQRKNSYR